MQKLTFLFLIFSVGLPTGAIAQGGGASDLFLKERKLRKNYGVREQINGYAVVYPQNKKSTKYGLVDSNFDWYIKPKYEYLSNVSICGTALIGENRLQVPGWEGGSTTVGYIQPKILDVKTKNADKALAYTLVFGDKRYGKGKDSIRISQGNQREPVALYNMCKGKLTGFDYRIIGDFSELGYALAFDDTNYTILNHEGEKLLPAPQPHGLPENKFYGKFDDKVDVRDIVTNNLWVLGDESGKKGLYDLSKGAFSVQAKYDDISVLETKRDGQIFILFKDGLYSGVEKDGKTVLLPEKFISKPTRQNIPYEAFWSGTIALPGGGQMANFFNTNTKDFVLAFDENVESVEIVDFPIFKVSMKPTSNGDVFLGLWNDEARSWVVDPSEYQLVDYVIQKDGGIIGTKSDGVAIAFDSNGILIERSAEESAERLAWQKTAASIKERVESENRTKVTVEILELEKNGKTYPLFAAVNSVGHKLWAFNADGKQVLEADLVYGLEASTQNGLFVIKERIKSQSLKKLTTCLDETYSVVGDRYNCDPKQSPEERAASVAPASDKGPDWLAELPCDHKMFKRKKNVAQNATINVSSTYCGNNGCYKPKNMVDNNRDEYDKAKSAWATDGYSGGWVEFSWPRPYRGMEQIYFVTPWKKPSKTYKVEVKTADGWKTVARVANNDETKVCHRFPATDISVVRIESRSRRLILNEVVIR